MAIGEEGDVVATEGREGGEAAEESGDDHGSEPSGSRSGGVADGAADEEAADQVAGENAEGEFLEGGNFADAGIEAETRNGAESTAKEDENE